MTTQTTTPLPPMAATVLNAGSLQSTLMRLGKEAVKKPDVLSDSPKQSLALSTAIYDGLAVLYNDAEVGSLVVVSLPNRPTMGNLNRILKGRGVVSGTDYAAYRAKFDVLGNKYPIKDRPLVLEKLTATQMKLSTGKHSFGREMAAKARELGEATPELTHARKLGPKGRRGEIEAAAIAEALASEPLPVDELLGAGSREPAPLVSQVEQEDADKLASMTLPPPRVGG